MTYLVTDSDFGKVEFDTKLEAIDHAQSQIEEYIDDGEVEEAEGVRVSKVEMTSSITGEISRSDAEVDEDGWDKDYRFWEDGTDSKPIYRMVDAEDLK